MEVASAIDLHARQSTAIMRPVLFRVPAAREVPPIVRNPLWNQTRPEVLQALVATGNTGLFDLTISCSRPRGLPRATPQCGYCSQCVDRRFSAIHAGLEEHDPSERYKRDVFVDELHEGEARTVTVSYLTFARTVAQLNDDALFEEFPQLYDCAGNEDEAVELLRMLRRHASAVLETMSTMVIRHADAIAAGSLPTHSLVRLAAEPEEAPGQREQKFKPSTDYRSVTFGGQSIHNTPLQAAAVRLLHEAHLNGTPELSGAHILETIESGSRSLSVLFKRSRAWNTLVIPGATCGSYKLNF